MYSLNNIIKVAFQQHGLCDDYKSTVYNILQFFQQAELITNKYNFKYCK